MPTPLTDLTFRELMLLDFLRRDCLGQINAIGAREIALRLQSETGDRWTWRGLMRVKERLVKKHGYDIRGWKGGGGHPPGLFIPLPGEEGAGLGQVGRTLRSHSQLYRKIAKAAQVTGGQMVLFDA